MGLLQTRVFFRTEALRVDSIFAAKSRLAEFQSFDFQNTAMY